MTDTNPANDDGAPEKQTLARYDYSRFTPKRAHRGLPGSEAVYLLLQYTGNHLSAVIDTLPCDKVTPFELDHFCKTGELPEYVLHRRQAYIEALLLAAAQEGKDPSKNDTLHSEFERACQQTEFIAQFVSTWGKRDDQLPKVVRSGHFAKICDPQLGHRGEVTGWTVQTIDFSQRPFASGVRTAFYDASEQKEMHIDISFNVEEGLDRVLERVAHMHDIDGLLVKAGKESRDEGALPEQTTPAVQNAPAARAG